MARQTFRTASAAIAMALIISCSHELADTPASQLHEYSFSVAPDTKATLGDCVVWEASDKVGMVVGSDAQYAGYAYVTLGTPVTVKIYSPTAIEAGTMVYGYYPYNSGASDPTNIPIEIFKSQEGASKSAMPLAAVPFEMEDAAEAKANTNGELRFVNLGSIINFKIFSTNESYCSETVKYISFESENPVAGTGRLDLTAVTLSDEGSVEVGGFNSNTVKVSQDAPVASSKEAASEIKLVVAPGSHKGRIVVVTDAASYTFVLANAISCERSASFTINANLANATRGDVPTPMVSIPYAEPFSSSQGEFTIEDSVKPAAVSYVWTFGSSYGMKASAYVSKVKYETESWLISPYIDLTSSFSAFMNFDHVYQYGTTDQLKVKVRVEEDGWQDIDGVTYSTGSDWTFVNSGTINLSQFLGCRTQVAFVYTSTSSSAPTWEIKNFNVKPLTAAITVVASLALTAGDTQTLEPSALASTMSDDKNPTETISKPVYSYDSSNPSVAKVSSDGTVTAVSAGSADITVSVNGYEGAASVSVTVTGLPDPEPDPEPEVVVTGNAAFGQPWLELPAVCAPSAIASTTSSPLSNLKYVIHTATMEEKTQRNYSILYDPSVYTSYWVAYPICSTHLGTGREESWGFDPLVDQSLQTKVSSGSYGVSYPSTNYKSNYYARGHQIPNADRNGVDAMMAQTYYSTNMTPQVQNAFNGGIWAKLEDAVRGFVPSGDTLYVVTGAAFRKVGGSETINTIVNTRDNKTLPVPNYYWKVVLKVKRSGTTITGASTIGFWLPHQELKDEVYTSYTTSVDQIEAWTGFDFFVNLPDELESAAESNSTLSTFTSF